MLSSFSDELTPFLLANFSALVRVFFGFYPSRKAAHLDLVDALSYE